MSTKRENREIQDRSAEIRRLEERLAELRPKYNMMHKDPLNFDEDEIPYGWEYHWFKSTIYDVPDRSRMVEAQQRGWTIVPPERHPDRCFADYDGTIQKVISHKGLICMERPKEIGDNERRKQNEYNRIVEGSMPGLDNLLGEATGAIPLKSYVNQVNWGPKTPASF